MRKLWITVLLGTIFIVICVKVFTSNNILQYPYGGTIEQDRSPSDSVSKTWHACAQETRHIYFLKVHKAGSTSMQNIFLRYALARNLNVLTIFRSGFMSYPLKTFDSRLPLTPPRGLVGGKYDMYTEHSIYNEAYLQKLLPADTVNIAIVREPLSQLRSTFEFYHFSEHLGLENFPDPVVKFFSDPEGYCRKVHPRARPLTQNRVAKEFGYPQGVIGLQEYLKYLDSKFLVLIMDRLEESLVVMKRKLCWDMKEIIIAQARPGNYVKPKVNATLVALHKAWSPRDYAIYEYFSGVMEQRIAAEDNDFAGEVAVFEDYLAKTREFCDVVCAHMATLVKPINREAITSLLHYKKKYAETKWSSGFVISGLDCLLMRLDPSVFREVQKVRLFPEYCTHPNRTEAVLYVRDIYCKDLIDNIIPWTVLGKPRFAAKCY